jgi:hypothetical protein
MIAQITEKRFVDNRWFLPPQEFIFIQKYIVPASFFYGVCKVKCQETGIMAYDILVGDTVFTIPYDMAALLNKDEPDTNMKGTVERWEQYATKDILAPLSGGHTDVVKQAKEFLGIDIAKHINNVEVDQDRVRELKNIEDGMQG